jgi:hypothetical protein
VFPRSISANGNWPDKERQESQARRATEFRASRSLGFWFASLSLLVTPLSIAHLLARAFSTARQPRTGTVRLGYLCCVKCRKSLPGYTTIFMCNYRHFVSSRLRNQTEQEGLPVCLPACFKIVRRIHQPTTHAD